MLKVELMGGKRDGEEIDLRSTFKSHPDSMSFRLDEEVFVLHDADADKFYYKLYTSDEST
jgi:hypothetical protein